MSYESTFMAAQIDPSTEPVSYDQISLTHTVYSEDLNIVGIHPYTVNAFLTSYPSVKSPEPDATAMIDFLYPCSAP